MTRLRIAGPLLLSLLLAACASSGGKRVSEPVASIQQLTVDARGNWQVALRLQNYSSIGMRFDSVSLALTIGGANAGTLQANPGLQIAAESADVVTLPFSASAEARLQVADALAAGRAVAYAMKGSLVASPEQGGARTFKVTRESALTPAPGLPGVLR